MCIEYEEVVPTWEAAARIYVENLLHGTDPKVKQNSADELVRMGKVLDRIKEQNDN